MSIKRRCSLPCLVLLLAAASCDDDDSSTINGRGGSTSGGAGTNGTGGSAGAAGNLQGGGGPGGQDGGLAGASGDGGSAGSSTGVSLELVASGLTSPVVLQPAPEAAGAFFVADQIGTIRVIGTDGQLAPEPFLDLRDRLVPLNASYDERGLLGMALHPEYASNGRFFVYYSAPLREGAPEGYNHTSHVSEFRVSEADPRVADAASERVVLAVDEPQTNHNGGQLVFGPDGYLYIALGDGGAANDVGLGHVEDWYMTNAGGNGQNRDENLLGKLLRIDVDAGEPYAVPEDNPFAGSSQPEIWAYGLRNPFRMSFDAGGTRQLFVADVGQDLWEEVNIVTAGGNYGWNVKEGTHCFSAENPGQSLADCPSQDPEGTPLVDPILEYPHSGADIAGLTVIGGYVYRGSALPGLAGRYVFGDWSASFGAPEGQLFVASPPDSAGQPWSLAPLSVTNRSAGQLGEYVLSFGEDGDGELYVLTTETGGPSGDTGKVYRLAP